ncbi:F-box protein CPR1-like [Quercus suber]|uniref:F-box protein CPR1-like n=1 Tax=Quercus suber TaxID=58331 RepID=UPI000CE1C6CA|nr:F-box protein CPR1-like [Quercus suber]
MSSMRESPILQNHLPHDLVLNILANLPVKSVLRFRCVRKSWNSSITSPSFISSHLKLNGSLRLLFMQPDWIPFAPHRRQCIVICEHSFDRISKFDIPLTFTPRIVGSCNGLLCLEEGRDYVYLLNPSIGKFKRVSTSLPIPSPTVTEAATGFGYDSETNDYKIVRIIYHLWSPTPPPQAEIYTLKSGSWRRLHFPLAPDFIIKRMSSFMLPIPFVSGALHWMLHEGKGEEPPRRSFILKFDVNEEKFGMIATPFADTNAHCHPLAFKGKLALTEFEEHSLLNLWVMKEYGVHQSWTKLFVVPLLDRVHSRFYGCSENGLLILEKSNHFFANGKMRIARKCISIDIETLHERGVDGIGTQNLECEVNFMESLVLLDGADMVPVRL